MQREHWKNELGFILAATGSAIGLGNLWKFPYIAHANNGGIFVIIYLLAIVLVGFPIMVAELMIGRRSSKNPVGAFLFFAEEYKKKYYKLFSIIGWMGIASGFVILSYYSVIAGWTLEYCIKGVTGFFGVTSLQEAQKAFGNFVSNPYKQIIFQAIFMFLTGWVVSRGIGKGIELANKIMMPILFFLVIVLAINSLSQFGATATFRFMFNFDLSNLTPYGALEALGHSFFTLSLGMGCMLTYGSYMKRNENIFKTAFIVVTMDTFVALSACFVMYPIIFAHPEAGGQLKSLSILFTTIPTILGGLFLGNIWVAAFYILVAFASLTSTISLLEVVVSYAVDEKRWNRIISTWASAFIIFIFGIPSALSNGGIKWISKLRLLTKGGERLNWLDSFDYLASNWMLPLGGLFICLYCAFIVRKNDKIAQIGRGRLFSLWSISIKTLTPLAVIIIFLYLIGIIRFK